MNVISLYIISSVLPMSEEIYNPSINLPRATIWTVPVGYLQGLIFILAIFFTLPDVETLLQREPGVSG